MKNSLRHIETLDYARAMAIIGVLLFHTLGATYGFDTLPWNGWFRGFSVPLSFVCLLPCSFGQAGVPIFFVVSGFCIHLSFQRQGQGWGGFFVRRFFRIYPAYFLALIFSILLLLVHEGMDFRSPVVWGQLVSHLFLVHNLTPLTLDGFNASFWSLAVEAQLYLLYPLLLFLVRKTGWRRTLFLLAGCELLIRGAEGLAQATNAANTTGGNVAWLLANSPLGYWFSWAMGARLAEAFQQGGPLPFAKLPPVNWLVLAVGSYFVKPLATFQFMLFAVATAAVMSRMLNAPALALKIPGPVRGGLKRLGLWSYSLYLLHQPMLQIGTYAIVAVVPPAYLGGVIPFVLTAAAWLVIIPVSVLWYRTIEVPGIAWGKHLLQGPKSTLTTRMPPQPTPPRITGMDELADGPKVVRIFNVPYSLGLGALAGIMVASLVVAGRFSPRIAERENNLAWSLATSAAPQSRDGARAVRLAEDACRLTQGKRTVMIGTLAAAYAEAGRFDDAIAAAQHACALARQAGDEGLLRRNEELLDCYYRHEAYHENK